MEQPHLVLVAGPPAAGKTTIAHQLARALHWPLLCKDTLKEALFDYLGAGDRAWSQRLGYATIQTMYILAGEILEAGAPLILESTFTHPHTPGELEALLARTGARLTVIYCHAAPEVLSARFNARIGVDRHPGHVDQPTMTPADMGSMGWLNRPTYPGRVMSVDTTDWSTVSIPSLLAQIDPSATV